MTPGCAPAKARHNRAFFERALEEPLTAIVVAETEGLVAGVAMGYRSIERRMAKRCR